MTAGLYIHIPFCVKKCNYCDFYSIGGGNTVSDEYVDVVIKEIKKYPDIQWKTVYFGGGTPSLLTPQQADKILSALNIAQNAEITLESNPETVTLEKLQRFKKAGINRISFGVQTANQQSLQTLGRIHSNQKVVQAFEDTKKAGFTNISGDVMLGLPNYTYQELDDTVELLASLGATHISSYMLKIEQGTPFDTNTPQNLPSEDEMCDFYLYACQKIESLGYKQYEISNFAKEGYQSQHNNIYWKLENYIGIGPSAHSCLNGERFYYPRDIHSFLTNPRTVFDGKIDADEYIMLSLRLKSGLDLAQLKEKWGRELTALQIKKLKMLEQQ
ncbi:MAG: radical SAM family heme chaperone HemW, partial [Oscillospiraceae bacterium]|nr:radical SAM family heme chaperone HemW [Oscillospiraceae bacterium]